jgi:Phosphotransferase enzyme family
MVRGKVLFGGSERPLIVPVGDDTFTREAIRLFVHGRVRRAWATTMLKLDRWLPPLRLLPKVKLSQFPLPEAYAELGLSELSFAVYCGSPGPLCKLTVFSAACGRSVTKIALRPSADQMVRNEGNVLAALAERQIGVGLIPRLVSHGQLSSGRWFVRTTVLSAGRREPRFGAMHREFLSQLHASSSASVKAWQESRTYAALLSRVAAIDACLDRESRELIAAVLADIAALSHDQPVAECVVHGDFAPWNITMTDRLCVFDWEYAKVRGNPLHDFLHFHVMSSALLHRRLGKAALRRLISLAGSQLERVAGCPPDQRLVGALTLQYIADTVIFYCEADGELKQGHPVIKAYMSLLRRRRRWLPADITEKGAADER